MNDHGSTDIAHVQQSLDDIGVDRVEERVQQTQNEKLLWPNLSNPNSKGYLRVLSVVHTSRVTGHYQDRRGSKHGENELWEADVN